MAHLAFIDADVAATQSIAAWLSNHGHQLTMITDGASAMDTVRHRRPDAIVLCVELPQVSGYTLCNKLKRDTELSHIPLLLVSSLATPETFEEHRRLRTRADAYAQKPYQVAALQALVDGLAVLPAAPDQQSKAATASAPNGPSGDRPIRFGEDPSVRDTSGAPFFHADDGGVPRMDGADASPARAGAQVRPAQAEAGGEGGGSANAPSGGVIDLSASTQVYRQSDLVGRALDNLSGALLDGADVPAKDQAEAGVQAEHARPKARRSKKPRASVALPEGDGPPEHVRLAALTEQVQHLEQERDRWRAAAQSQASELPAAAASVEAIKQELAALQQQNGDLAAQCQRLREELAGVSQQKAAAEHATFTLRQGLAALVDLDVQSL